MDHSPAWKHALRLATLLPAAWLCACADEDDGAPSYDFCESEIEVGFDPVNGLLLPFPSDLYLKADPTTPSGFRVNITEENRPKGDPLFAEYSAEQEQLNRLDGFGTTAAVTFGFSAEIGALKQDPPPEETMAADPPPSLLLSPDATTAASSPVVLIGIHAGSPDEGQAIPLLVEYLSGVAADGTGQHYLLAEPAYPLRPKTTYAMALTRRLTDAQGACVAPSEATRRLLTGAEPETFGRLGELAPRAVALLAEGGFIADAGELSALTVFTTQSTTDELVGAAAAIQQGAAASPPTIVDGSIEVEASSGGVALEVYGKFVSTSYLGPDGTFVTEGGLPVAQGTEEIEFQLMVPEATAEHQPPFPLIIYQHGLLGNKKEDGGAKRAHARAGFATVSIDAVAHGSRLWDTGYSLSNFFAIDFIDGKFNIPKMRDNFRQTYLDVVQLAELAPALAALDLVPDGAPDGVPEIAASPLYITGHSLGGLMSSAEAALIPDVRIGAFNAGGGGMLNMIRRSELFGNFIIMLKPEEATMAEVYRFMPILQTLAERGDPLNFSTLVIDNPPSELEGSAAKHVLFQEVEGDTFVPNHCNEAIARGLGMGHLKPVVHPVYGLSPLDEPVSQNHPSGMTSAFFQFDYLEDGNGELVKAEHTESYGDRIPQAQWIHFFETFRDTGAPEVIDPYRVLGIVRP